MKNLRETVKRNLEFRLNRINTVLSNVGKTRELTDEEIRRDNIKNSGYHSGEKTIIDISDREYDIDHPEYQKAMYDRTMDAKKFEEYLSELTRNSLDQIAHPTSDWRTEICKNRLKLIKMLLEEHNRTPYGTIEAGNQ